MPGGGRTPLVKEARCAVIAFGRDCDVEDGRMRSWDEYPLIFGRETGREGGFEEKSGGI
jgi:hypothetical protein